MTIRLHRILRWTGAASLTLGIWFAAMAALTVAVEPTDAVIVLSPDRQTMKAAVAGADVALLDGSERLLRVTGQSPGFVARLYASGAWLVLPARAGTCITPPPGEAAQSRSRG
jgi:hypothetical protein